MLLRIGLCLATCVPLWPQSQTHTVRVNADGTFMPRILYIKSGDTVRWEQLSRTDTIIPVTGTQPYPAVCTQQKPYSPADFTGPSPFAPSGVFTLSPLDNGFTEVTGNCPAGTRTYLRGDNGQSLCTGGGAYAATLKSTWLSDQIAGVFIRLLWSDVNPRPGVYDFSVLQREVDEATRNGKVYSLGIKAGDDGTPDWIFTTNADGSARSGGGGGVPRLKFQDADDDTNTCGNKMDLGNPTRATYKQLYLNMLTEVAQFIKSRNDWYRALAYVKISGANLVSHENRLPNGCVTVGQTQCPCNTSIFASDGYRPSGLYAFYDEQMKLLSTLFPGKPMSYALIQDGFPRVNETGGYLNYNGNSSNAAALPGAFEQTQTVMDNGQEAYGMYFVVQHNGIKAKPAGCNFDGVHPKPVRPLDGYWDVGSGCPNRWAVREGAQGQITGFQTVNRAGVTNTSDLDLTFQNAIDNSDSVFLEIYEDMLWEALNNNRGLLPRSGKSIAAWGEEFHKRRLDTSIPALSKAPNPYPSSYSFTFKGGAQSLYYVNGTKCGKGNQEWGLIVVDAQPPSIKAGGVTSAAAFGQSTAIAPGSWIEIYGSNLAALSRLWTGSDFAGNTAPTSLEGTTVRIGGQAAFVDYVSFGQVNAQVPSNVATGQQQLTVSTGVGTSANYAVTVNAVQPGLLATAPFVLSGRQNVVALFSDGATYVLPPNAIPEVGSRRARPGDTITLYGIGFGPVTPSIPAGEIVSQSNTLVQTLQISIGGVRANANYSGLAPNAVGLYQFNVVVPSIPASDATPVTFTLGGVPGTQTLFLAVGN